MILSVKSGLKRLAFLFLVFTGISCSNTKDNFVNRTFHNLSAHYNGYYNAGLKLEDALDKLAASHVDHYDRILKVFQYADATKAKAIYPLLEDAMKRTSTAIDRHTIIDRRGNEKADSEKWIDDNWLLYGKCQFFKHDYFEAMETFKYVETTYRKDPGRHLGSLWIAKTYLELTQLREAEAKLDYLRNQADFPKKFMWEQEAVNADYHLQTKNYDQAIEHLTRAASLVKKRESKIRWLFILAQLHQKKENYKQAFQLYTKVIKMNPPYEMAFNARLNRARCYDNTSTVAETVLKELLKMEKDPKNREFLDQIYYALAGLEKNKGHEDQQVEYLNKSVRSSVNNQNQKALSYLELGKISYDNSDYRTAQGYYDSTITNLAQDYPDYSDILTRRNSLTKLVKFLRTIETEDSLQALARLSPAEQEKAVDKFLEDEERERVLKEIEMEKQKEAETQSNQIFDPNSQGKANELNRATGSNWYFYNPQAISFGFNEFTKKWGERKLEDNWRRSKKQLTINYEDFAAQDSLSKEASDSSQEISAEQRKTEMLAKIPNTQEALDKSTNKVVDAYYNVGMIYREQLNNPQKSVETFEELLRKYPDNKFMLQTYYQLYRIYAMLGNTAKSEYYKNIILTKHGDTEYAEIIRNPNALSDKEKKRSKLEMYYEETYRKYLNGEYASVIARKTESEIQFPQNELAPKFDLLKTLSIGRTQPLPVFEASLNDIIRNHSNDSVKDVAQEILDFIHNGGQSAPGMISEATGTPLDTNVTSVDTRQKLYQYKPDTLHNVVLILQNIGGAFIPDKLKNKISDFNSMNFGSKSITMQDFLFDHRLKIIVMRSFDNKQDAMQYFNLLYDNDDVFGNVSADNYQLYAISVNNLPTLIGQKKTDKYEDFFRSFYK